jgi:hypothetical protein
VAEKVCTRCGQLNQDRANYCSACGAHDFTETPAEQVPGASQDNEGIANAAVLISPSRIVALSAVTAGLYFLYWLFITWKQLQGETREVHHPVWHALTMFVPVYGLFRLHKHVSVMQELAVRAGIEVSFTPGLAAVLVGLYIILGLASTNLQNLAVLLVLNLIRFSLIITTMILSQSALNAYWNKARGASTQNMPMEAGERAIIMLGIIYWLYTFLVII